MGIMTEFSGRISESLRGMGLFEEGRQFDTAFWGPNVQYADTTDVNILKQRGRKGKSESSGGGKIEQWLIELPDAGLN